MKRACGFLGECEPGLARERVERMAARLGTKGSARFTVTPAGAVAAVGSTLDEPPPDGTAEWLARTLRRPGAPSIAAALDETKKELLLAVDPFGIETLYFCRTPAGAVFASSLSSLIEHPDVGRDVDPQSIFNYVYFHAVPAPRSIYRGVERLDPGEYVVAGHGAIRRGRYWRPRYEEDAKSERELAVELRARVRSAVRSSVESAEARVGAFLSGGCDSSTVVGVLGEITAAPPSAFSIGFQIEGYDESKYARIAASHFGAEHHRYVVTPEDFEKVLPRLAEAYDEPFGNSSAVASYFCARLARENGIGTLLGGDGGDEIFGGNERYRTQALFELYHRLPRALRRSLLEPLLGEPRDGSFALLRKARSYVRQANTPLPDRLQTYNFVQRMTPRAIFTPEFLNQISIEEPLELLRKSYAEAETNTVLNRLLYLDVKFTLADNDLRKVGTTCDMAGVEARYPFLDPELVDFANRLPPLLKVTGRKLRYLFKRASEGFLPDAVLKKRKHGFGVPAGRWMRDHRPLRDVAHESLRALVGRGFLRDDFARSLVALHEGEHTDYYGVMVYVLCMLELWHRKRVTDPR